MGENPLISSSKLYIEQRLLQTKRKFELVYSSAKDTAKQQSLKNTIKDIDRDLKKLHAGLFDTGDLKRYKIELEELSSNKDSNLEKKSISEYKILRNIRIDKLNRYSNNTEVNSIWSYILFFGKEYLGLLSEQNLKLDYGHSFTRDKFFTTYNELIRAFERYGELLEQIDKATTNGNKDYRERLLTLQGKSYRDLIIKSGNFLRSLEKFIEEIFDSEQQNIRVLVEPEKIVSISGEVSNIDGITAKDALLDLYRFVQEFIDFIKIPEIKKIEENE
jgi:hypothetical protein